MPPAPAVLDEPIATILGRPLIRLCAKRVSPYWKGIGSTGIFEGSLSMGQTSLQARRRAANTSAPPLDRLARGTDRRQRHPRYPIVAPRQAKREGAAGAKIPGWWLMIKTAD